MSRYDNIKINNNNNNLLKRYYNTVKYPTIDYFDNDIYIESQPQDKLDVLANEYYNDVNLWWIIHKANNLKNFLRRIPPGIQLRIPMNIQQILKDFEEINSNNINTNN